MYGVILPGLTDPLHVDVSIEGDASLGGLPHGDGSPGHDGGYEMRAGRVAAFSLFQRV